MKTIKELAQRQLQEEDLRVDTDIFDIDVLYVDYGGGTEYIDSIVSDMIGAYSPVYDSDLLEMFEELYHNEYLDIAISEIGSDNMEGILRGAYDLYLNDVIYENIDIMIRYYILSVLEEYEENVTEEEFEDILGMLDDIDYYSIRFISDINDTIDNTIYDVLLDR